MNSAAILSHELCDGPRCAGSTRVVCVRCERRLCTWHHVQAIGEGAQLEPVCFPECEAEYWDGAGVREVRPRVRMLR